MNFKPFSIEITTEQEANAFAQILDWAVRHAGLQGASAVAVFQQKAVQGQQAAEKNDAPELDLVPSKANGHEAVATH